MHLALACWSCSNSILPPSGMTNHWQLSGILPRHDNAWLHESNKREVGCSISHEFALWSHRASLMTRWIMHVSCQTTMPQCHAFTLTTQRCTNSNCSWKVVSVSSLVARIPSAASMWIKPSRKQSIEIHRQHEAQKALAWIGLLWRGITSLLGTILCTWGT